MGILSEKRSSEILVTPYQTKRCHNPEDRNMKILSAFLVVHIPAICPAHLTLFEGMGSERY
jgi:hypothetical protein